MTREELIGALSDLRDYHTVSKKTCDYLNMDLLRCDCNYSAGNDSRVAELLEYLSPTEAGFSQYIDYTAFTIVANVSRFSMHVPTDDQILHMLEISGYSGEEMQQYVRAGMPRKASCISATHLVPSVWKSLNVITLHGHFYQACRTVEQSGLHLVFYVYDCQMSVKDATHRYAATSLTDIW